MSRYGPEQNAADAQQLVDRLEASGLTTVATIDTARSAAGAGAQVLIRDGAAGPVQMIVTVRRHNIGITGMDRTQPPYSLPRNAPLDAVCVMVRSALEYRGPIAS